MPILRVLDRVSEIFFGIMRIVVKVAPLGALGAIAFTVGSYGLGALGNLAKLMAGFYLTAALFVFVVLAVRSTRLFSRGAGILTCLNVWQTEMSVPCGRAAA